LTWKRGFVRRAPTWTCSSALPSRCRARLRRPCSRPWLQLRGATYLAQCLRDERMGAVRTFSALGRRAVFLGRPPSLQAGRWPRLHPCCPSGNRTVSRGLPRCPSGRRTVFRGDIDDQWDGVVRRRMPDCEIEYPTRKSDPHESFRPFGQRDGVF